MKKNLQLKILSVVIALFLFRFVSSETNMSEIQFPLRIEVKNLPSSKMIIWPPNRQVQVSVKGPSFDVGRIAATPRIYEVDLPAELGNRYMVALNKSQLNLPPYVQVVSIVPAEIEFLFDEIVQKQVRVYVPQIGATGENFKLESAAALPDKVTLRGPKTELKDIETIETVPLDIREVTSDMVQELSLRVPGSMTEASHKQVRVEIKVSTVRSDKVFTGVPVEVRQVVAGSYVLNPSGVNVTLSGPAGLMRSFEREKVLPYVRIPSAMSAKEKLKVLIDHPAEISVVLVEPESIEVTKSVVGGAGQKRAAGDTKK